MEELTSGVSVGQHKSSLLATERVGVEDGLEEERRQTDGESWGAGTILNGARVGHMAHVIGGVEILAVPAAREEQLGTETITALALEEVLVRHEVAEQRILWLTLVVETVEADGLLSETTLGGLLTGPRRDRRVGNGQGELAASGVTSDHGESGGEGLGLAAEQVVAMSFVS